ncbi:hypothetical protein GQ457_05G021150 [Hibiscus cannabinus]
MQLPPDFSIDKPDMECKLNKSLYGLKQASRKWNESPSMSAISSIKEFLHEAFKIKDLGDLKYFLGFEVARSSKDVTAYRKLIGKLLYLTNTCPDILFVVQQLSQFLSAPTDIHMMVVQRILLLFERKSWPKIALSFANLYCDNHSVVKKCRESCAS